VELDVDGQKVLFERDENIMEGVTLQDMAEAPPVFISDGTITKLNSSSINDGAASLILMSEAAVKEQGLSPMAEYLGSEVVGVQPEDMGIAPAEAIQKLLGRCHLTLGDIGLIECNEAYAAQWVACQRLLDWKAEKVNVNGGSIALGHPLGCTGLRICMTLIYSMMHRGVSRGLASMCAGGGMGQSVLFGCDDEWRYVP
jgi:acetyl-CoA C-acetyltransferase